MEYIIPVVAIPIILLLALVLCIACDRIENRWRLGKIKRRLVSFPDSPEVEFLESFPSENRDGFPLMRNEFAALFSVAPEKIHAEWNFVHEKHMQNFIPMIYASFARAYAPPTSLSCVTFQFPKRSVLTVKELFLEADALKNSESQGNDATP